MSTYQDYVWVSFLCSSNKITIQFFGFLFSESIRLNLINFMKKVIGMHPTILMRGSPYSATENEIAEVGFEVLLINYNLLTIIYFSVL